MGKQYHFVVTYDTNTKRWDIDSESLVARFDDGFVWDDKEQDWISRPDKTTAEDYIEKESVILNFLYEMNDAITEQQERDEYYESKTIEIDPAERYV